MVVKITRGQLDSAGSELEIAESSRERALGAPPWQGAAAAGEGSAKGVRPWSRREKKGDISMEREKNWTGVGAPQL